MWKNNFLPKGLTPLEDLFDSNDILKKLKMEDSAIKTKFNDFVVVPNTLDLGQLTK